MTKKNFVMYIVLIFVLVSFAVLILLYPNKQKLNTDVVMLFVINGFITFVLLLRQVKRYAYSLEIMHWFFCFFFFFLAPLIQYYVNFFPWIVQRSDIILIRTSFCVLLWIVAVCIGIKLATVKSKLSIKIRRRNTAGRTLNYGNALPILTLICIITAVYRVYTIGFVNLLSRATSVVGDVDSKQAFFEKIIQGIIFFSVAVAIVAYKKNSKYWGYVVVNMGMLLLSYFPTGLSRNMAAVMYLGVLLLLFDKLKNNRIYILLFTFSFVVILPFLSAFRNNSFNNVNLIDTFVNAVSNIVDNLKNNDYDAFTQFTLTLEHVDSFGTGGNHLLSDLLFFVPRDIWPTKAFSASYEIAHERFLFDNVSFPLPAVGYIDAGHLGMILFGIVVGFIIKKLDLLYWNSVSGKRKITQYEILYPILLNYFFFMCRGDLYYIFGYTVEFVAAWVIVITIVRICSYRRKE